MSTQTVILIMIGLCGLGFLILAFGKPFRTVLKMALQAIVGLVTIFFTNLLLSFTGVIVGINLLSAAVVAVLGIPGVVMLFGLSAIL